MTSTNVQTFPGEVVINGKLTVSTGLTGDGSAIENIQSSNVTDFASNVSRITNLESGSITLSGQKTFQDEVTFESNIRVQGDLLVANTVNMVVSDPIMELGANNLNTGDLGIIMTRHGVSNSNVAVFYDETADILKMGYTLGGANDTTITLENDPLSVSIQGTLEVDTANVNTMNVSAIEGLQTLSFSSDSTTVPPLQLTAGSLNDGVGALRIDSVEPDIFLNDTDGGFSTVTFANNGVSRAAFGRNDGDDFYITVRDPATNGGNWRDTSFVVDSSTGDVSMGYGLTATSVSGDGSGLTALNGDQVTTGTVAAARIANLDGSKITTGTISRPVTTTGDVTAASLYTDRYIFHTGDTNTYMDFSAADTFRVVTAGGERLRINSSGNVGIGTDSPSYALDVTSASRHKSLLIYTNFGNNTARPPISTGSTHPSYEIRGVGAGGGVASGYSTGADDGFLRLRAGGGTNTANASYIDLSGYSVYSGYDMKNNITFGTNGSERMRISIDGNVTKPYQSACRVSFNNSDFKLASGSVNIIVYNYELYDINNDYNTSTGKFTCPYDGRYLAFHVLTGRNTRYTSGIVEAKIFHNTAEVNRQFIGYGEGNYNATASCIISASKNDTINAGVWNGNSNNDFNGNGEGGGSQFIVYFLG